MNNRELPQILRVKRKRTDDPLQALVMETSRRQLKRPRYVFKLKRTEERDIQDSTAVLTASSDKQNNKPVFNIPSTKKKLNNDNLSNGRDIHLTSTNDTISNIDGKLLGENSGNDDISNRFDINGGIKSQRENKYGGIEDNQQPIELNPELLEMLNDYLKDNDETTVTNPVKPPKRRQSSISQELNGHPRFNKDQVFNQGDYNNNNNTAISEEAIDDNDDDEEYVFDVYYRDKAVSDQWETEHIGYIKFDDEDIDNLDEKDDDLLMNTDDEDSNDENFYRNDYPDDEDGGYEDESSLQSMGLDEPSDDQDDEFDILNNKRRFSRSEFLHSEGLKNISDDEYHNIASQIDEQPTLWERRPIRLNEDEDGDENMESSYMSYPETDTYNNNDDEEENEEDGDQGFQRNVFFQTDREDPIAINRDRIFGKLQKMIDETGN